MLRKLLNYFIERKLLINLILLAILIFGVISITSLKRESMPEVDLYQLYYTTIYPGASPENIELKVTIPLEDAIKGVENIKNIQSTSYENVSRVIINLEDDLTTDEAEKTKMDIQKAIDRVTELPIEALKPSLFEVKMTNLPIIEVALAHEDSLELRRIANYLSTKIEKMPEIKEVTKVGYLDKELHIALNPYKLIDTETPINDVVNSLKARNIRLSGGTLKGYDQEKGIITNEELVNKKMIENVIVRAVFGGKTLRISDLGKVEDTLAEPSMYVRSNGTNGISLAIVKKEKADVIRTIRNVKKLVNKEMLRLDPKLTVEFVNDKSTFTKNRIKIVLVNALMGFVLVFICLKAMMDFRTAIWTAFGIPFSLLIAFIVINMLGMSINPISLGGFIIVIGMLVDDAIVVAENIKRHKEEGDSNLKAVQEGVYEVAIPVITTILTTVVAFMPFLFVSGLMGKFMKILPIIVIVTLMASLYESLFILPSHMMHKEKNPKVVKKKKWVMKVENAYEKLLSKILKRKYLFVFAGIVFFIFSVIVASKTLKFETMPSGDVDTFYIKMEAPNGTSLKKMSDMMTNVEKVVATLPKKELASFGARVGTDSTYSNTKTGVHTHLGIIFVYLTPQAKRVRDANDIMEELKLKTRAYENLFKISYEKEYNGPPLGKPVDIRLVSDSDAQRLNAGNELLAYVKTFNGIIDPKTDVSEQKDEYKLKIDYERMAELGLSVYDVASTIRTAYEGVVLFSIRKDNEEVDYRVILDEKYRGNMDYLLNLPVRNMMGKLVLLKRFARFEKSKSVLEIVRYNNQRTISISADLDKTKMTSLEAINKAKEYYKETLADKYPDVEIITSGEAESAKDSLKSLMISLIIAILGIWFILILLFNSILQPMIILAAIPFGFIGVIWAFVLHGQNFSFPSLMGFVGLTGVIVNDSLIMVDYINKLNKEGNFKNKNEFLQNVVKGAKTRLRPIILTSVTTVLGLLPTVYGWGGTDFILVPMTMSLAYGLGFATIITLFLIPSLMIIHYDVANVINKVWEKKVIRILSYIFLFLLITLVSTAVIRVIFLK
ncbi:MAG: hypothetical protein A2Y40_05780 [Candidatus Margulisbacteria bacterium GWF2_35_9]|nr:MAG: hypothetical protein A2Y40_05780 [Candidatus Margulisbacteria bacterium GWF2_35_9]